MNKLLLILLLTGCRTEAPPPEGLRVVDDRGRVVHVPVSVRRVLSLAPSNTELVFALGAADLLVGRTDACDVPAEAAAVPSVGGLFPPDLERILLKRPDVVLMIDGHAELRADLTSRGVAVLVLQPHDVEGVFSNVRLLGQALRRPAAAGALEARMRREMAAVQPAPGNPAVLVEIWADPVTGAGPGTFVGDLLRRAGGRNVVPPELGDWPQISLETLVKAHPDVIIASSATSAEAILAGRRPGLSQTPAARSGRVYVVPQPDWLVRPGPRLVQGLAWMAASLAETPGDPVKGP